MDNSKAYRQVIDNLVYHATNVIIQALHDDTSSHSVLDIITTRQSAIWNQLDNIVAICSTTYHISIEQIISDYTTRLAFIMTQKLNECG
jgi:hypothetical protein